METALFPKYVVVLCDQVHDNDVDNYVDHFAKNLEVAQCVEQERHDALDHSNRQNQQIEDRLTLSQRKINAVRPHGHGKVQNHGVEAHNCETEEKENDVHDQSGNHRFSESAALRRSRLLRLGWVPRKEELAEKIAHF